jgi:EAL and modified HD-GYP domain-containing signal transduction protein
VYIARQPILDRERCIAGYELLFRSEDGGGVRDGALATAQVAVKAFSDPAFADALGPHRGFLNVDAVFIASPLVESLPPARTVLEILEDTAYTPDLVERVRALRTQGYTLAADDFRGDCTAIAPALEWLDIVKLDLPQLEVEAIAPLARALPGKILLAEKVETQEQFERCVRAGCTLFQGFFFARPQALRRTGSDPGKLAALRLLALVAAQAADAKIEDEIKRQPALGMGLLRLANSAAAGLARRLGSIREALVFLGRRPLQRWLQLLVYVGAGATEPARNPLLQLAAVRGKTMELLAMTLGSSGERAFMTGLASLYHVAVGLPLEELLAQFPFEETVCAALRSRDGELGALLALAEALERADDAALATALARLPALGCGELARASREAIAWAGRL